MDKNDLIKIIIEDQRIINRFMRQSSPDVWMDVSLTIAQVKSLFYISNNGSVNFRMLAAALKVTPSNVTGIIDRLVDQGLVSRTENPDDRRMLMLQLTPQGETLISGLRERRFSQMSAVLSKLNEDELEVISRSFKILGRAIEDYNRSGQGL